MGPGAAPGSRTEPVRVEGAISDARRAVRAGLAALAKGDAATAIVMVQAGRTMLGAMAERYQASSLAPTRERLAVAALDLAAASMAIRDRSADAAADLSAWLARS